MNELKYAVVCVDDDPYILQMLGFQLGKVINQKLTLLEYFTDPNKALEGIDEFGFVAVERFEEEEDAGLGGVVCELVE